MKREKILNYARKIDELIKSGEYVLFETALSLYLRGDIWDIEKIQEGDLNDITSYIANLDTILDSGLVDKVEEKLGDVL